MATIALTKEFSDDKGYTHNYHVLCSVHVCVVEKKASIEMNSYKDASSFSNKDKTVDKKSFKILDEEYVGFLQNITDTEDLNEEVYNFILTQNGWDDAVKITD